jgi:hypothetical protein
MSDETLPVTRRRDSIAEESGRFIALDFAVEKRPDDDTLHRIERKIDALQRRVESIDRILSLLINRA